MTVIEPIVGMREARNFQIGTVVKAVWSRVRTASSCVALGAAVVLAYWWLLLPAVCWLTARAALRATQEVRAQRGQK